MQTYGETRLRAYSGHDQSPNLRTKYPCGPVPNQSWRGAPHSCHTRAAINGPDSFTGARIQEAAAAQRAKPCSTATAAAKAVANVGDHHVSASRDAPQMPFTSEASSPLAARRAVSSPPPMNFCGTEHVTHSPDQSSAAAGATKEQCCPVLQSTATCRIECGSLTHAYAQRSTAQ